MRAAILLVVAAACGHDSHSQPATAPPPGNHTAPQPDPRVRAEQALRDAEHVDYTRPFDDKPVDRTGAIALYVESCRGSDRSGCWIAMTISSPAQWRANASLVDENCRGGDTMSCRALPADEAPKIQFPSLPGATGRSEDCRVVDDDSHCDREKLRGECTEGFPLSCTELAMSHPPVSDRPALMARAAELSAAGCTAGIVGECHIIGRLGTEPQQAQSSQLQCDLEREFCDSLAKAALTQGNAIAARDRYERACEYGPGPENPCIDLAALYLEKKLVEPVPGRGQALLDWACARVAKDVGAASLEERVPACKRATHK